VRSAASVAASGCRKSSIEIATVAVHRCCSGHTMRPHRRTTPTYKPMPVPEHLQAFLAGGDAIRRARLPALDLRNAEISVSKLEDVTIERVDLSGAVIHRLDWREVPMREAVLDGTRIASGEMHRVRLDNLTASAAAINVVSIYATLKDINPSSCDLSHTGFYGALVLGGSFADATSMASTKLNQLLSNASILATRTSRARTSVAPCSPPATFRALVTSIEATTSSLSTSTRRP
jgi:uncharacterized protein YjbI with pentapeptide repeats